MNIGAYASDTNWFQIKNAENNASNEFPKSLINNQKA